MIAIKQINEKHNNTKNACIIIFAHIFKFDIEGNRSYKNIGIHHKLKQQELTYTLTLYQLIVGSTRII